MPIRGDELVVNPLATDYVGPHAQEHFYVAGWLLARAIKEKILVPTQLSPLFTRNLVGRRNGLNQMASLDEDMYNHICKLKSMTSVDKVNLNKPALLKLLSDGRIRQRSGANSRRKGLGRDRSEQAGLHIQVRRLQSAKTIRSRHSPIFNWIFYGNRQKPA